MRGIKNLMSHILLNTVYDLVHKESRVYIIIAWLRKFIIIILLLMIQIILCKDANLNCVINVRISLGCNFRWTCTNIKKHIQKYLINQSKTPLNNVWFNNMKRRRVISIMEMGRKGRREETFEMTYITNFVDATLDFRRKHQK